VPNKHKTATIGWNPGDPTLKPWIEAEAGRRGITRKALLDEALSMYREQSAELAPGADAYRLGRTASPAVRLSSRGVSSFQPCEVSS
jgi:hypothetical protein